MSPEAETGVTWPRAEGCWQPPELAGAGSGFPLSSWRGHRPVDISTADVQLPERGETRLLLVPAPSPWCPTAATAG